MSSTLERTHFNIGSVPRRAWFFAYAITVILACLHGGQCIVFRDAIPGDLADSRLVNCILEHGYQCLRGYGKFLSPAQFYPVKGTLVYGDNHFGTVLFYSAFRALGASMEGAFQCWIILVLGLNTVALLYVLRQLRVHPLIACALAFFGTSSSALVYKTVHPQILPFFPFILCLGFTCKFLVSADVRQLAFAALWFAYQSWCYMYHGYFSVYICGIVIGLGLLCVAQPKFGRLVIQSFRDHWLLVSALLLLSVAAVIVVYFPYARFSARAGTHPFEELQQLAPNPGAWFSASPDSIIYSKQQFYKPEANTCENTLFSGWAFWLLSPVMLAAAMRHRSDTRLRLAFVLTVTMLLLVCLVTTWSTNGPNLYLTLAKWSEGVRAFRAFPRIVYLLIVMQAIALALFVDHLYRRFNSRSGQVCVLVFAFVIPVESLAVGQSSYSKTVAQQRGAALMKMWKDAGAREVLVFAPGYSNQRWEYLNIECWRAALLLHKKTLNGYSGNTPPSHADFVTIPTENRAKALLARLKISPKLCSIVTDWPEQVKRSLNIETYHIAGHAAPFTAVKEIALAPLESNSIPMSVHSDEQQELDCDVLRIYASYRLFDVNGAPLLERPSLRTDLHVLRPGDNAGSTMHLQAPSQPGVYEARLSIVHEGVAWWADNGYPGSVVRLVVLSPEK